MTTNHTPTISMTIYTENGYESRAHYLRCLAEENDVPLSTVHALASILGPSEDFDGLVTSLEDAARDGGE
jgi:hypothetical protein